MTDSKISAAVPEQAKLSLLTPGAMLRDAREQSGQTHAVVGEALHLTVHYIKALENDDYSKLPGLIFVKGYIRSYGTYLKMDVDALIRSYDANVGTVESSTQSQINPYDRRHNYRRRNDQSHGWALVTGFIVIVALAAGWWFVGRDQGPREAAAQASTPAGNNSSAAASAANTAGNTAAAARAQTNLPFGSTNSSTTPTSAMSTMGAAGPQLAPDSSAFDSTSSTSAPMASTMAAPLTSALGSAAASTAASTLASASEAVATAAASPQSTLENTLPTADVTSAATSITPNGEIVQSTASEQALLRTTVTEDGITIIPAADGSRQVSMFRAGNDELLLRFAGNSWVEIDDGSNVRLYNDMLNTGDTLMIQGTAPFQVLLGNARNVEVNFNDSAVDIAPSIRTDDTARVLLSNSSNQAPVAGPGVAQ